MRSSPTSAPACSTPKTRFAVHRKALGAVVFAQPEKLRELERILHPRMRRTFEKAIARTQRKQAATLIVLDAAILFEAGWNDLCDLVAFVDAPREIRLARLGAARGWNEEQLRSREQAQLPPDRKRARADLVIANSGDDDRLQADLDALRRRLQDRPRSTPRPRSSPSPTRPPHKR